MPTSDLGDPADCFGDPTKSPPLPPIGTVGPYAKSPADLRALAAADDPMREWYLRARAHTLHSLLHLCTLLTVARALCVVQVPGVAAARARRMEVLPLLVPQRARAVAVIL